MLSKSIANAMSVKVFPVVEFSIIVGMVVITYLSMSSGKFGSLKPLTRMSASMLLGSVGYMVGKTVVTAYAF